MSKFKRVYTVNPEFKFPKLVSGRECRLPNNRRVRVYETNRNIWVLEFKNLVGTIVYITRIPVSGKGAYALMRQLCDYEAIGLGLLGSERKERPVRRKRRMRLLKLRQYRQKMALKRRERLARGLRRGERKGINA